ncbi:hypothetical protein EVAR_23876_1 [Eumeta japonica]|uniref:Uncharacterized protein n=1 Tax=Eumeta variegata TaxID=151549 RepID=A0A4C1V3S1_EUMVA|nr:hypothetical protein EVAR_23876_1 [Eumeta japonica]
MYYEHLIQWVCGQRSRMRFGVPMQWKEQKITTTTVTSAVSICGLTLKNGLPRLTELLEDLTTFRGSTCSNILFYRELSFEENFSNMKSGSDFGETAFI